MCDIEDVKSPLFIFNLPLMVHAEQVGSLIKTNIGIFIHFCRYLQYRYYLYETTTRHIDIYLYT